MNSNKVKSNICIREGNVDLEENSSLKDDDAYGLSGAICNIVIVISVRFICVRLLFI